MLVMKARRGFGGRRGGGAGLDVIFLALRGIDGVRDAAYAG